MLCSTVFKAMKLRILLLCIFVPFSAFTAANNSANNDLHEQLKKAAKSSPDKTCITRTELADFLAQNSTLLMDLREQCTQEDLRIVAAERTDAIFSLAWTKESAYVQKKFGRIPIDIAVRLLEDIKKSYAFKHGCGEQQNVETPETFWDKLTLKRKISDDFDPRKETYKTPAVLSYTQDETSLEHRHQLLIIGSLNYRLVEKSFNDRLSFWLSPGIDADVEPLKEASDTILSFSVTSAALLYFGSASGNVFESLYMSFTPKFTTDRALNRKAWEASLSFAPTSKWNSFPMGVPISLPLVPIDFTYTPRVGIEWQHMLDAPDNNDLAVIETGGTSLRPFGAVTAVFFPNIDADWAQRLTVSATCTWRYDHNANWTRYFLDAGIQYDLTDKREVAFTVTYRRGRKPPDFSQKDHFLIGIGLRK